MGIVQFAFCFYQMATRFLSDSPGFECKKVYGEDQKQIQKLLCEALDKSNGEYASPINGSKNGTNPYIRCTNAANSDQPCLPADVGDSLTLTGRDGKYHAVKVDVLPALKATDYIDLAELNQVSLAFNEVFSIYDEALCDDTGKVGWFPHPEWMEKVNDGDEAVPVKWRRKPNEDAAVTASLYKNVWVKKVQSTDATQHKAGIILRNLFNTAEMLTEYSRMAIVTIVATIVATTFPNFLSSMKGAIASATTLMQGLSCLKLMTALGFLIKNQEARNHAQMREQVWELEKLQNETGQEVETVKDERAKRLDVIQTLKGLQQALTEFDPLKRAGYNRSGLSRRASGYPDVSGNQNLTLRFTGRTAGAVATCILAIQEPFSTALRPTTAQHLAVWGDASQALAVLDNVVHRTGQMHGLVASGTRVAFEGMFHACASFHERGLAFTGGADSKELSQATQDWFPFEQEPRIYGRSALELAARGLGMTSIRLSEDAVRLHDESVLTLGNINAAAFSNPRGRLAEIAEELNSLAPNENLEKREKLLKEQVDLTKLLDSLKFQLSNEPTYAMAIYDKFNGLYLGSFTTALFAWGDENNEGREVLMAVVRALQEAAMNIKGAVLDVYDRTKKEEAARWLFSDDMRSSNEFQKMANVLSKLTGREADEIRNDDAFIKEIKDIFSNRFGASAFSTFMELMLKQKTRTVLDCQESGDNICKEKLTAELHALQSRLDEKLPRSPPPIGELP